MSGYNETSLLLNDIDDSKGKKGNQKHLVPSPPLRGIIKNASKPSYNTFYKTKKSNQYLSTQAFNTLLHEMAAQNDVIKLQRSYSDGDVMPSTLTSEEAIGLTAEEKRNLIAKHGRRALYGALPFVSTFGMGGRENSIRSMLSTASCNAIYDMMLQEPSEFQVYIFVFTPRHSCF